MPSAEFGRPSRNAPHSAMPTARRRPRTVTVILVFLLWIDGRTLWSIIFPRTSASFHFYSAINAEWVHWVLSALTLAFAVTAVGYLWRPAAGWAYAVLIALGFYVLQTVVETAYMVQHLDLARETYMTARQIRHLPARPETADRIFTPDALWLTTLGLVVVMVIMAAMAWRKRDFEAAGA